MRLTDHTSLDSARRQGRPSRLLVLAGLAAALLTLNGAALAQSTFAVEPPVAFKNVNPSQSFTSTLRVSNPTKERLRLRAYLNDWSYDAKGEMVYQAAASTRRSASPWVTFTPAELTLGPGESSTVRYTVQVPKNAEPGSHWTVLFLDSIRDAPATVGQPTASFKLRVGHVLYVNVQPGTQSGKITGVFSIPPKDPSGPQEFRVRYVNNGNVAQKVLGRVEVRGREGNVIAPLLIPVQVVLPGATRDFVVKMTGPFSAGNYVALAVLNYGDKDQDVAGEVSFTLKQPLAAPTTASAP